MQTRQLDRFKSATPQKSAQPEEGPLPQTGALSSIQFCPVVQRFPRSTDLP